VNCFTANQITDTVFKKKIISLQIKIISGDELVAITCGLSLINTIIRL